MSPATNAFTIADIGRVKVSFGAPDYVLSRVRLGQELTIQAKRMMHAPVKGGGSQASPQPPIRETESLPLK